MVEIFKEIPYVKIPQTLLEVSVSYLVWLLKKKKCHKISDFKIFFDFMTEMYTESMMM